eukprot:m.97955 g.97955  ORF g.97955 m.97955 type:complete len:808 (+) comp12507_c0_seq2:13-2436(+)
MDQTKDDEAFALFECLLVFHVPPTGAVDLQLAHTIPENINRERIPIDRISIFCAPYDTSKPISLERQTYTYGLTMSTGEALFGYCLKDKPATPASTSVILSVVTKYAWSSFFHKLLTHVAGLYKMDGSNIDALSKSLNTLRGQPSVNLNAPLSQELRFSIGDKNLILTTPDCTQVPLMSQKHLVRTLINTLSSKNILQVLTSLMAERRVILTSSNLSTLGDCISAFSFLLFPFKWQHVYIPALPHSLIDYCCATFPIFIGVHSSLADAVKSLPLESLLWVDLDEDSVYTPFNDANILPHIFMHEVSAIVKSIRHGKKPEEVFIRSVLGLFVDLFTGYTNFIRQRKNEKVVSFDVDRFVLQKPKLNVLLRMISSTQMFTQFIHAETNPQGIEFDSVVDNRELFDEYVHAAVSKATWKASQQTRTDKVFKKMRKKGRSLVGKQKTSTFSSLSASPASLLTASSQNMKSSSSSTSSTTMRTKSMISPRLSKKVSLKTGQTSSDSSTPPRPISISHPHQFNSSMEGEYRLSRNFRLHSLVKQTHLLNGPSAPLSPIISQPSTGMKRSESAEFEDDGDTDDVTLLRRTSSTSAVAELLHRQQQSLKISSPSSSSSRSTNTTSSISLQKPHVSLTNGNSGTQERKHRTAFVLGGHIVLEGGTDTDLIRPFSQPNLPSEWAPTPPTRATKSKKNPFLYETATPKTSLSSASKRTVSLTTSSIHQQQPQLLSPFGESHSPISSGDQQTLSSSNSDFFSANLLQSPLFPTVQHSQQTSNNEGEKGLLQPSEDTDGVVSAQSRPSKRHTRRRTFNHE